ncbi:MAG: hypothetical protein H0T89_31860 [Deltaproteobacteria bacterium]|nr:hypothetical protein [Deltaproteobacteria bacterium]MDQ3295881.1 hypothetical protein [Myxococcota bacterium]
MAVVAALGGITPIGCGGGDDSGPLGNVDSLVVLQRPRRNDMGDIFQYTSYKPGARLVKLSPPTADGTRETLFPTPAQGAEFAAADISGYDISFDARTIVLSAKLADTQKYGLFLLTLDTGTVDQIPTDAGRDYVSPIFLPGDRIMFTTNAVVEANAPQHVDEYERGTTLQLGRMNLDGTNEELGPRNLSHRTFPTLASDGRVMFTQWDHLGPENAGHLMFVNQDMQELREGFGKEGTGASNSTLKAQEIAPGRFVAIATARNRTVQAGALIDIRLGTPATADGVVSADRNASEANASYASLTPDVPRGNEVSADTVGRYYDAYPLNAKDKPDLLVSWADGPVESSVLGAAGLSANFGVYLYDTARQARRPILDDPEMWDIFARPLQTRTAPPLVGSANDNTLNGALLIGSMNAYDSSLKDFVPGSIFGIRIIEGFSSEEGFPRMFGTTMFEGQAQLGVARLAGDGSWLATVPANVPLALQAIDNFGMSLLPEPVWFSGRPNESRVCGGCHEDRVKTTVVDPGLTQAFAIGPTPAHGTTARADRESTIADLENPNLVGANAAGAERLVGMAWDRAIQPVLTAKCAGCHDGTPGAANPTYTIMDPVTGTSVSWTFNLTGNRVPFVVGGEDLASEWPASYFSIAGPDMEAIEEGNLVVSTAFKVYMKPQDARGSLLIQKVNPTRLYPTPTSERAFPTAPHSTAVVYPGGELTATEFLKLILAADLGVNYYARENNPGLARY